MSCVISAATVQCKCSSQPAVVAACMWSLCPNCCSYDVGYMFYLLLSLHSGWSAVMHAILCCNSASVVLLIFYLLLPCCLFACPVSLKCVDLLFYVYFYLFFIFFSLLFSFPNPRPFRKPFASCQVVIENKNLFLTDFPG